MRGILLPVFFLGAGFGLWAGIELIWASYLAAVPREVWSLAGVLWMAWCGWHIYQKIIE